jgi:hypothetical protein
VIPWLLGAAVLPLGSWACTAHPIKEPDPTVGTVTQVMYDVNPGRLLDLVFVIDNSDSMLQEQENLTRNFPLFIKELEKLPGGLPDIRIAVVSSNFGAGPNVPAGPCTPYGDRGRFLMNTSCPGVRTGAAPWLEMDINKGTKNFDGDLADVFQCVARLGNGGCGYEHQLQALRASLYDVNPENRGFLRPDASLGIIIMSDEDDCSAEPYATFFDEPVPAGQATSLVCSTLGHVCDGQEVPATDGFSAPLGSCKPYVRPQNPAFDALDKRPLDPPRRQRLINVSELVDSIKATKPGREERIVVSAIVGWPADPANTQYRVAKVNKENPARVELDNVPICESMGNGRATAGVRWKSFIEGFGANGSLQSICQDDFRDAVVEIAKLIVRRLPLTCLGPELVDTSPAPGLQPECLVVDRVPKGNDYEDHPLPQCGSGVNPPCWTMQEEPGCVGSRQKIVRVDGDHPAPVGTLLGIKCLTCTATASGQPQPGCTR